VELRPPKIYSQTVRVWVVYALERDAKDKAIEWMLITTHPVENFADAQKRVEWYSGRWGIEVFHRTLKAAAGLRIASSQPLIAWKPASRWIWWSPGASIILQCWGRETPDASCTVFFKDIEWKALCCYVNKKPIPPDTWANHAPGRIYGCSHRRASGKKRRRLPGNPDHMARPCKAL